MSKIGEKIDGLFTRIDTVDGGQAQEALIGEAIALAVGSADARREYDARMRFTASVVFSSETDAMLASFDWCLARHDSSPENFPLKISSGADLLGHYPFIIHALASSSGFPRDRIDAAIADMAVRYQRAGLGRSGVLSAQFREAWLSGRLEEADRLRREIAVTTRDSHSRCAACGRSDVIRFLSEVGSADTSIILMDEFAKGYLRCAFEPETAVGHRVLPYLRLGQFQMAESAHVRAYRVSRGSPYFMATIARQLVFCAVTGNEVRGLLMLERHLDWLGRNERNQCGHFEMLCSMAVLLDAVSGTGFAEKLVVGSNSAGLDSFFGRADNPRTVSELATAAWNASTVIGAQFDARNGNSYYSNQTSTFRALATERYNVPSRVDIFSQPVVSRVRPKLSAKWLTLAQQRLTVGDFVGGGAAAQRGLDGAADPLRIDLYRVLICASVATARSEEAQKLVEQQVGCLRNESRHEEADLIERVGLGLFGRKTDQDILSFEAEARTMKADGVSHNVAAEVHFTLANLYWDVDRPRRALPMMVKALTTDDERIRSAACSALADLSFQLGRSDDALEYIDRVLNYPADLGNVATVLELRARIRGSDQYAQAVADMDEACAIYRRIDAQEKAFYANLQSGHLLSGAGRYLEAAERFRLATTQAFGVNVEYTGPAFQYGRALVQSGLGAEARDWLQRVFDDQTGADASAPSRATTLEWLGRAMALEGQHHNAVAVFTKAIQLYVEGGSGWLRGAIVVGTLAGRLRDSVGEHDEAIELLTTAVERAQSESGDILLEALHALGRAQANNHLEVGLDTLDEVLSLVREVKIDWVWAEVTDSRACTRQSLARLSEDWYFADVHYTRAYALRVLGRLEEAADTAAKTVGLYLTAGDSAGAGHAQLLTARILAEAHRTEESIAAYTTAIALLASAPQAVSVARCELGNALESLGRVADGHEARALGQL